MRITFLSLVTLVVLSACNKKIKETGMVIPSSREYSVRRNKSLEVPPHYEVPAVKKIVTISK